MVLLVSCLICHIVAQHFVKYPPKSKPPHWIVSSSKSRIFSLLLCVRPDSKVVMHETFMSNLLIDISLSRITETWSSLSIRGRL